VSPAEVRPVKKPVPVASRRGGNLPFAAGLFVSGVVIAGIVILLTGSSNTPTPPRPAKLQPLTQHFADKELGVTGYVGRDWIVGGKGAILRLGSTDGKAIIAIVAPGVAATAQAALTGALAAIRKEYKHVTVKRAPGSSLGGRPAQSLVVYATNLRHASVRILLATASGKHYAYALQASTSTGASLRLLEETQETIATLRFSK
jgi:hypothetical protein